MAYTILLFLTRKPTISPEEFKDYWENTHIPLLQSLTGPLFPTQFTRRYLARIHRKGFGGPANPDRPPLLLRGTPDDFDWDAVGELTFENEKAFSQFYNTIYESDIAAKLADDEAKFIANGSLKAVVVGETTETTRNNVCGRHDSPSAPATLRVKSDP
ncbi:EthD domain-domain-containing protein [Clohesyomyces aquaticus]|uniref:EthD domain-domain-containing protein n=1 Tax=Clohesyomyces aquaticus TaxID=1231657 RepID=A0A1Y1YMJ1_9PLEO|nr:EthD domain-domain-containing protein [Clohesyomyces aquaticus]